MPILSELRKNENAALGVGGVTYYNTLDSLPITGLTSGDQAFVSATERYYVSDGNGWFNTTLINKNIRWDSGGEPNASYDITDSATPLIIIARAADSDQANFLNQSFASDSAQYMATITNDSSVFTFTPKTAAQIGASVAAGDLTDSNGDFIYTFKWSDGLSFVNKAVTITYNPSGGGGAYSAYGSRAIIMGGNNRNNVIDYYDITTPGNASDFGSTLGTVVHGTAVSSGSRVVYSEYSPVKYATLVPATTGNASEFGDHYISTYYRQNSVTDGSRGVFGGTDNYQTNKEYITIASTGTASDWGYNSTLGRGYGGGAGNGTIGLFIGGSVSSSDGRSTNVVDYITIQVPSDATDFGDLSQGLRIRGATSDTTRAICGGGMTTSNDVYTNEIQYFTMATTGNSTDFGDLTRNTNAQCTGDGTYATWNGGMTSPGPVYYTNVIERVTIQTPGNSSDFGDLYHGTNTGYGAGGNGHVCSSGAAS